MVNTFSTLFYLKDERCDKNGKAGLYLRITVDGRRASISLHRKIEPSKWNSRMNKLKGKGIEAEEEEEVIEEPANEEPVKVVETTTSFESNGSTKGNGDYHVVVGLFSEPSNAEKLVSKLKSSGHNAMILGTFDHLQMVVVKSFPSREDAVSSMREIRSSIEDRAWVFKY